MQDEQREGNGQPGIRRGVEHLLKHQLIPARRDVGHELDQPPAAVGDAAGDLEDLVRPGVVAGDLLTALRAVGGQPRRREAERPGLDRFGGQRPHPGEVLGGRGLAVGTALTHHVHPQRRMRQIGGDVDVALTGVEGVEVLREGFPVPRQAVDHHHTGDVLDAGHHVDQHVVIGGPARCEADATVAHHGGRDAVRRRRIHPIRPDRLPVVVSVQVDEAWRDEQPGRVDLSASGAVDRPDRRDDPVGDRDIADVGFPAKSVDDGAVTDDQVVAHLMNLRLCRGDMPG